MRMSLQSKPLVDKGFLPFDEIFVKTLFSRYSFCRHTVTKTAKKSTDKEKSIFIFCKITHLASKYIPCNSKFQRIGHLKQIDHYEPLVEF